MDCEAVEVRACETPVPFNVSLYTAVACERTVVVKPVSTSVLQGLLRLAIARQVVSLDVERRELREVKLHLLLCGTYVRGRDGHVAVFEILHE